LALLAKTNTANAMPVPAKPNTTGFPTKTGIATPKGRNASHSHFCPNSQKIACIRANPAIRLNKTPAKRLDSATC